MGPLLGHVAAVEHTDKLASGADPSYISYLVSDALPFGVCKSVEILLGRCHFFLIMWIIHMSTLKNRKNHLHISILYLFFDVCLPYMEWILSTFACLGAGIMTSIV